MSSSVSAPAGIEHALDRDRRGRAVPGWAAQRSTLAVLAITALGLALRLRPYGNSLFGDELSTYYIATHHSLGAVLHILHGHSVDLNPPLYFVLAWASEKVGGDTVQMLRLASLLAGVATIPLTYLLGVRTIDRRAGLLAAALVALSPFLIDYSAEARPYSLLAFMVLAAALALLEALRTGRLLWWGGYAALSAGCVYVQYTSLFALAGLFVWAFVSHAQARRRLVVANLVGAALFAPWIPALLDNASSPGKAAIGQLDPFGLHAIWTDLGHLAFGNSYVGLSAVPGAAAKWLLAAAVGLGMTGLLAGAAGGRGRPSWLAPGRAAQATLPLVLCLSVPIALAIYSALTTSVWDARNLISVWPALAVLLGALASALSGAWRWGVTVLLLGGFAVAAGQEARAEAQRPDYAGAAGFIASHSRPSAPVVDTAFFTPGPPTALEAALGLHSQAAMRHPVLRLGLPPLKAVLHAPPYAHLPLPSGSEIAHEAVTLAHGGEIFFVTPGHWPPGQIRAVRAGRPTLVSGSAAQFFQSLPHRFRLVRTRWFSGAYGVTVVELRARRGQTATGA